MKPKIGPYLVWIAIGVCVFAFAKSVDFFKKNQSLVKEIDYSLKPQIMELQLDRTRLKEDLDSSKEAIANLETKYSSSQNELFQTGRELSEAKKQLQEKENQIARINNQISQLTKVNNELQDRFGTILADYIRLKKTVSSEEGLKEALAELKKKQKIVMRVENKIKSRKDKRGLFGTLISDDRPTEGNYGFLIRDGKSTFAPRVKITVTTVEE